MSELKALKFEDLTLEQKLGMVSCGYILCDSDWEDFDSNLEYTVQAIKEHRLGSVWMSPTKSFDYAYKKIMEAADYPVLIFTDAECGFGEYLIGKHGALGATDNEEYAYAFGKVVGVTARKKGYNVVCNPVIDLIKEDRFLGTDKKKVAKLAAAMVRGMHDAGILSVAKHYPSATIDEGFDDHMEARISYATKEQLLDYSLYTYLELDKQGLLDGIMTSHCKIPNIDPVHPTSLSKDIISIIREQGFEGFIMSDCLRMMGVVSDYGWIDTKGLCIEAGNDIALDWDYTKRAYDYMVDCYNRDLLSDARLDEAVKRVLATQEKVLNQPAPVEITEKELENFNNINKDSICAITDEGLNAALDRDKKHLFAVMVENGATISDDGKITLDTFNIKWFNPNHVKERLEKAFPNSSVMFIDQFSTPRQNMHLLHSCVDYDDVVFMTFTAKKAYSGLDRFTSRILSVINALMRNKRISALVHFGTATVLEDLTDHFPRVIIGGLSPDCVDCTLDVLEGKYPAKGTLPYEINLK